MEGNIEKQNFKIENITITSSHIILDISEGNYKQLIFKCKPYHDRVIRFVKNNKLLEIINKTVVSLEMLKCKRMNIGKQFLQIKYIKLICEDKVEYIIELHNITYYYDNIEEDDIIIQLV